MKKGVISRSYHTTMDVEKEDNKSHISKGEKQHTKTVIYIEYGEEVSYLTTQLVSYLTTQLIEVASLNRIQKVHSPIHTQPYIFHSDMELMRLSIPILSLYVQF